MEIKDLSMYRPLLYKKALDVSLWSGVPFEDCYQQAYLIAVQCVLSYKEDKGASYFTWLCANLSKKLISYCSDERLEIIEEQNYQELIESQTVEDKKFEEIEFADYLYSCLSLPSIELVRLVLDNTIKFKRKRGKKYKNKKWENKITKSILIDYLSKCGWRKKDIIKSFNEIKDMLREWRMTENGRV